MAAFGTKKPAGDLGVQLGFPLVFNQYFSMGHSYYPSDDGQPIQLLEGTNFQSDYHAEKRQYANKTVMDGLQARRTADRLLLTGRENYHLPKPVLGQRVFANPSYGQLGIESARRDGSDAPFSTVENGAVLRGGVVHTAEGFKFYNQRLSDRIEQLDRINALTLGYTVSQGYNPPISDNTREGSVSKVSFFITLRALSDAILQNDINRFTFENLKELLRMLFSVAPSADIDTLNDAAEIINDMVREISALESGNGRMQQDEEYVLTIGLFVEGMRRYTDEMIRNVNLSDRDKLTLSKSLIKTLGFDRLMPKKTPKAAIALARIRNERINQSAEDLDADDDMNDDDDNDGKFNAPASTREDDEARGIPRAPFAGRSEDPNRAAYGRKGRRINTAPSYFDDMPTEVAPLNFSGSELASEIPEADTTGLVEALNAAMEDIKYAFVEGLTPADAGKEISDLIQEKKIYPSDFITILEETLLDAGFSKGDIATAMQINGNAMFSSYIAQNLAQGRVPPPIRNDRPLGVTAPTVRYEPEEERLEREFRNALDGLQAAAAVPSAPSVMLVANKKTAPSSLRTQIDNAMTKDELQRIYGRIPESQKRGATKPHGNTSVANLKKILYSLV